MKGKGLGIVIITLILILCCHSQDRHLDKETLQPISQGQSQLAEVYNELLNTEQESGTDSGTSVLPEEEQQMDHRHLSPSSGQFWEAVCLALFLACCGAFCSGLGVGLLSISKLELKMMKGKKNELERKMATRILGVISHHHLFLVTLLIANAIALESLPLVIHLLMPDWMAIITSTVLVLIVAQIVPQAFCTGPHKIKIAYYASPIIAALIKIFWIVAYPTARFLDYLMGEQHEQRIQHKDFATFLNEDKFLNKTQKLLLTSTLDLRGTRVHQVMIAAKDFFMVEEKQRLDQSLVDEISAKDYSYVLVYRGQRSNIIGIIKIKEFAIKYLSAEKDDMLAGEVMKQNSNMLTVYEDTNLLEMLMLFQAKSTRVALVCNQRRKVDTNILSIMYSKSDMVYSGKGAEVVGVIFLYQIFNEMAEIKTKIEQKEEKIVAGDKQYVEEEMVEMKEMERPLLK